MSTRGSAPNHNIIVDTALQMIAWVGALVHFANHARKLTELLEQPGVPIWRWFTEAEIRKFKANHLQEMRGKGLVP